MSARVLSVYNISDSRSKFRLICLIKFVDVSRKVTSTLAKINNGCNQLNGVLYSDRSTHTHTHAHSLRACRGKFFRIEMICIHGKKTPCVFVKYRNHQNSFQMHCLLVVRVQNIFSILLARRYYVPADR